MDDRAKSGADELSQHLVMCEHVMMRNIQGEAVLLDLRSEIYLGLDEVGARMWHLITSGETGEAAIAPLLAEYDVEEAKLRADLRQFVRELLDRQLMEVARGTSQ